MVWILSSSTVTLYYSSIVRHCYSILSYPFFFLFYCSSFHVRYTRLIYVIFTSSFLFGYSLSLIYLSSSLFTSFYSIYLFSFLYLSFILLSFSFPSSCLDRPSVFLLFCSLSISFFLSCLPFT